MREGRNYGAMDRGVDYSIHLATKSMPARGPFRRPYCGESRTAFR